MHQHAACNKLINMHAVYKTKGINEGMILLATAQAVACNLDSVICTISLGHGLGCVVTY